MDASTLPKHLNFLNDAAHLLRVSAPETSAHLMSHHNELMLLNGLDQTDTQRQHVCGACGHIMIPGQGTFLKMESRRVLRKKRRVVKAHNSEAKEDGHQQPGGMRKLFTCGNCSVTTKITCPPPPPVVRRRIKSEKSSSKSKQAVVPSELSKPLTVNSSSKKRAKNRKAGLQALLSQAKKSSSGSRSLSLADFTR